ncbi:MAG: hypothetical protein A3H23_00525 [Planctomycetes bacterium RIFCSPLOWO2_12_FULL_40_19]|nr:MAG: hypothetical protein A3H23_00525 [Planctomycetes bacterium RIFCSPLOWO2_12_FULL_40_19]
MKKYEIALLCIAGGLLLTFLFGRHEWKHIEINPDSRMYHLLAVNMLQGKGYYLVPVGSIEDYDTQTIERFSIKDTEVMDTEVIGKPFMARSPGYPLFLSLIYLIHGVNVDVVLSYQIFLVGLVGTLMILTGWLMWGKFGAIMALIAVLVFGMNRDVAYPVSQLLTECLAMFFLTAAATSAAWAKKGGGWKRELLVSLIMSLAILTRPALVYVGLVYGVILIFQSIRTSWGKIFAFAGPCTIILLAWSVYASLESGHIILISSNGIDNLFAGLDPVGTAEKLGLKSPELNVKSLQHFWECFPGGIGLHNDSVLRLLADIPNRLSEVILITVIKLKAGTDYLLRSLLACILLGFALTGSILWRDYSLEGKKENVMIEVIPRGLIRSHRWIERFFLMAAFLLVIIALGFSTTIIQAFFWILPALSPFFRLELRFREILNEGMDSAWPHWILSWYWGYFLMTMIAFGIPRFMRPFLPVFYLCASMAIPMLVMALMGLRNGALKQK